MNEPGGPWAGAASSPADTPSTPSDGVEAPGKPATDHTRVVVLDLHTGARRRLWFAPGTGAADSSSADAQAVAPGAVNRTAAATEPPAASASGAASPDGADQASQGSEPVTAHGIAAVVRDRLGAATIKQYAAYPPEPGKVSLIVTLRSGGPRDMFAVSVASPEVGSALGDPDADEVGCQELTASRTMSCEELADGRIVTADLAESGFSEDNAEGVVVFAASLSRDGSGADALYESYDRTPPVTATRLAALLGDPRLTWRTPTSTNVSGLTSTSRS